MTTSIGSGTGFEERLNQSGLIRAVGGAALALLVAAGIGAWLVGQGRAVTPAAQSETRQAAPATATDPVVPRTELPATVYLVATAAEASALTAQLARITDASGTPAAERGTVEVLVAGTAADAEAARQRMLALVLAGGTRVIDQRTPAGSPSGGGIAVGQAADQQPHLAP
jgi:hypothetical protein